MLELHFKAASTAELRLQVLGFLAMVKDVDLQRQDGTPIDTSPLDKVEPITEPTVTEEIKPVITQEQMAENVANAPVHEEPEQPTIEELRAALKALRDRKNAEAVKAILKDFNASNVNELKPEDYLSVIARATVEV